MQYNILKSLHYGLHYILYNIKFICLHEMYKVKYNIYY